MKPLLAFVVLASTCALCSAADVVTRPVGNHFQVLRLPFGSGTPAAAVTSGTETAKLVVDGLYHVPNYLPGFPTAATIWPRELPLECVRDPETDGPTCTGFEVLPAVGRGEYIFVRPVLRAVAAAPIPALTPAPAEPLPLPVAHKKPLG